MHARPLAALALLAATAALAAAAVSQPPQPGAVPGLEAPCPGWGPGLAVEPTSAAWLGGLAVVGGEAAPPGGLPGAGRAAFLAAWNLTGGSCEPLWDLVVNTSLNDALAGVAPAPWGGLVALVRSQSLGGLILGLGLDGGVYFTLRLPGMEGYWGGGLAAEPGGVAVAAGSSLVAAVNLTSLQPVWGVETPWPVEHVAASPDGRVLAVGGRHLALLAPGGSILWAADLGVRGGQLEPRVRGAAWLDGLALLLVEYYEPQTGAGPRSALVAVDPSGPAVAGAWRLAAPWGYDSVPAALAADGGYVYVVAARQDYGEWLVARTAIPPARQVDAWLVAGSWEPRPPDAPYSPLPIPGAGEPLAAARVGLESSSATAGLEPVNYIMLTAPDSQPEPVQVSLEQVNQTIAYSPGLFGDGGVAPAPLEAPNGSRPPATTTSTAPPPGGNTSTGPPPSTTTQTGGNTSQPGAITGTSHPTPATGSQPGVPTSRQSTPTPSPGASAPGGPASTASGSPTPQPGGLPATTGRGRGIEPGGGAPSGVGVAVAALAAGLALAVAALLGARRRVWSRS
ncbi:MAG: hypothetical protein LRS49_03830 [Desulfurococcales archaeon]|nr:hypothetical protein [Desulfurococcales archaeon]